MTEETKNNIIVIEEEFKWLNNIIKTKINEYVENKSHPDNEPLPPDITGSETFYARFVKEHQLTADERRILALIMMSETRPEMMEALLVSHKRSGNPLIILGGISEPGTDLFIPTLQTALFLIGGYDYAPKADYFSLLNRTHKLFQKNIITDIQVHNFRPNLDRVIRLSEESFARIFLGEDAHYEYSADFPTTRLETELEWEDLVLCEATKEGLKELLAWLNHGHKLRGELAMSKNIQPGYRILFYGPSGTGKTLSSALLGKKTGKDVYRVDLSQIVSKYVGETEKNLERIFKVAEHKDWILFFDEADALFGKRTDIGSANDRFANQETAYLLQRIESCPNIVILASNLKKNLDQAFTRRFQSVVYFPMPEQDERLKLWQGVFSDKVILDDRINLQEVAREFSIAGGSIVNVARFATLMALEQDSVFISKEDLLQGIEREYNKQGRTVVH